MCVCVCVCVCVRVCVRACVRACVLLNFFWVVIYCTVRKHWGKVAIAIDDNLLGMDPIYQEEARNLSSFFERVSVKVVDHSGQSPVDRS